MRNLILIAGVALIATAAQIVLKRVMAQLGPLELNSLLLFFVRAVSNVSAWISMFLYAVAFLGYLFLMSRLELSYLYPITISVGFIFITIASWLVLGEQPSVPRILGLVLLMAGTILVGATGK